MADSGRSLSHRVVGATAVGISSIGEPASKAGGVAVAQWLGVEQCSAGQWEHSCPPRAETLAAGLSWWAEPTGGCSAVGLQRWRVWAVAQARGATQPLTKVARTKAAIREQVRIHMSAVYPLTGRGAARRRLPAIRAPCTRPGPAERPGSSGETGGEVYAAPRHHRRAARGRGRADEPSGRGIAAEAQVPLAMALLYPPPGVSERPRCRGAVDWTASTSR